MSENKPSDRRTLKTKKSDISGIFRAFERKGTA